MAEKGHNLKEKIDNKNENNKDVNVAVREVASCWMSPTEVHNQHEFLEKAKSYAHLVTEGGLLANPVELQKVKSIVPIFVVNKHSRKIYRTTNK